MDIISTIEGAVNGFLSNPYIQLAGRAALLYLVLLWLASAYWAYRDLQSRTANPIAPYLAAVFIILCTPFLFLFGILLYRLIRPQETVEEANERALAQEAMLREMQTQHCQTCGRRVDPVWLVCPHCSGRLRTLCPVCNRIYELDWLVCAWCGVDPSTLGLPAALPTAAEAGPVLEPAAVAAKEAKAVVAATDATAVAVAGVPAQPVAVPERRLTRRRRSDPVVGGEQDAGTAVAPLAAAPARAPRSGVRASRP